MPRTAGASQLSAELPSDLVEEFREKSRPKGGVTAVLTTLVEKFCGRKPTKTLRKRGPKKKLGEKAEIT